MIKKVVKIFMLALAVCGIGFSVGNITSVPLQAAVGPFHYHGGLNDCFIPPYACHIVIVTPKR